jgi:hypothetical protein
MRYFVDLKLCGVSVLLGRQIQIAELWHLIWKKPEVLKFSLTQTSEVE